MRTSPHAGRYQNREKMRRFFQTSYAAASWSKPRKIVARVEASEQGSDIRFIVTNLPGRAKVLYEKVYCARGRMENSHQGHEALHRKRNSAPTL